MYPMERIPTIPDYSYSRDAAIEKQRRKKNRFRLIIIVSILILAVVIAGVVVGGLFAAKQRKNSNQSSQSNHGSTVTLDDPNDPSKFKKDQRLKKVMWAVAYTPDWAVMDFGCGATQETVIKDIQLLSQLTSRLRLYGGDCNQTAMVLEAIRVTKVEMEVYAAIFVVDRDDDAFYRQATAVTDAIKTYGAQNIAGIAVGNEFILNYLTDRGGAGQENAGNTPLGKEAGQKLLPRIREFRKMIDELGLDKTIPIGTSDAGSFFNNEVLEECDFGLSNVHAWFADTSPGDAASWVADFFQRENVIPASGLPNQPTMYVSETGWPTGAGNSTYLKNKTGNEASVENLQIFIDNWICMANEKGIGYFFFEFIDEQWKEAKWPGLVESHWGLFDKDYNLKDITLPDCVL